jgi:hypothetical protein
MPPGKHRGVTLDQREDGGQIPALRSGREHAGMRPTPTRERELTGKKGLVSLRSENPVEAGTKDNTRRF